MNEDVAIRYEDPGLVLHADHLVIRRYYFPVATAKRIPYARIRAVRDEPLRWLQGRYRLWGMDLRPWWFPLDFARPFKERCIVLDVGATICPAITAEDHETALALLREAVAESSTG